MKWIVSDREDSWGHKYHLLKFLHRASTPLLLKQIFMVCVEVICSVQKFPKFQKMSNIWNRICPSKCTNIMAPCDGQHFVVRHSGSKCIAIQNEHATVIGTEIPTSSGANSKMKPMRKTHEHYLPDAQNMDVRVICTVLIADAVKDLEYLYTMQSNDDVPHALYIFYSSELLLWDSQTALLLKSFANMAKLLGKHAQLLQWYYRSWEPCNIGSLLLARHGLKSRFRDYSYEEIWRTDFLSAVLPHPIRDVNSGHYLFFKHSLRVHHFYYGDGMMTDIYSSVILGKWVTLSEAYEEYFDRGFLMEHSKFINVECYHRHWADFNHFNVNGPLCNRTCIWFGNKYFSDGCFITLPDAIKLCKATNRAAVIAQRDLQFENLLKLVSGFVNDVQRRSISIHGVKCIPVLVML